MKKIKRDTQVEAKVERMVFADDPEMINLGMILFQDYIKSFKHFIKFKRDYIDIKPKTYKVRNIRDKLYGIAKHVEKERRSGSKQNKGDAST